MPSRVAATAKIVVCVTTGSGSCPVRTVPLRPSQPKVQTRQLHALLTTPRPATPAALSPFPYQYFHLSHRHQSADLTKMDAALARLFVSNAHWAEAVNTADPGFFEKSAEGQSPKVRAITAFLLFFQPCAAMVALSEEITYYHFRLRCTLRSCFLSCTHRQILWLGCSDSRVPESVLTASRPGDIFVHRNIANQVHPDDDSVLSVITYAVEVVGVEHSAPLFHARTHTCC